MNRPDYRRETERAVTEAVRRLAKRLSVQRTPPHVWYTLTLLIFLCAAALGCLTLAGVAWYAGRWPSAVLWTAALLLPWWQALRLTTPDDRPAAE